MMRLDANALSQCVTNLLSNAEKYSRDERWIRLKVRRVMGFVEVVVSDKGIGIPTEDIEHILNHSFVRRKNRRFVEKAQASVLPLPKPSCKHMVELFWFALSWGMVVRLFYNFPDELLVEEGIV